MRVWVNPDKMAKLGITATDVNNAIQAQNRQNPAGAFGQPPSPHGTDFQYPVNAPGRLVDPQQFEDIVLRAQPDASLLRIRDIGRVELGAQTYSGFNRVDGQPSGNLIIYLSPGANAVADGGSRARLSGDRPRRTSRRAWITSFPTTRRCSCARRSRTW